MWHERSAGMSFERITIDPQRMGGCRAFAI